MYPLPFFLFFIPSLSSYFYSSSSILLFLPIPPAFLHHGSFYILLSSLFFSFSIFSFSPFSFHLSLYPIPSFSFSSTYPFSSLIHPASIYFLSLASQYTPLLFSHLHLVFLFSSSFIFSVLQSPLLPPPHSFPFFFSLFSMSRLLLLILFFIFLFFFPSSFFHDPPLHPPSILLSSSSYNYPILIFYIFFFVLILLLLCFLQLSLCPSFPLSHLHPAADFLHITLGLLTYFFIYIYPPK